jgi:hypothetical protein
VIELGYRLPAAYFSAFNRALKRDLASGVFVQPALLNGFVESGNGLAVSLLGGRLVAPVKLRPALPEPQQHLTAAFRLA